MKNLLSLLSLAALLLFTSCGDNEVKSTRTFTSNMVNSVTSPSGSIESFNGKYMFEIDNVAGKMNITAQGVQFNSHMPATTFVLKDVPFTLDNTGYSINAKDIVPEVGGQAMTEYTISQLTGKMFPGMTVGQMTYADMVSLTYTLTGGYTIKAMPQTMTFLFNSSTVVNMGETNYTNTSSVYSLNLDVKADTASIAIVGAKFADKMPAMNMAFTGLQLSPTATGYKVESASLIPKLFGNDGSMTPFPSYTITNLVGTVLNNKLSLSFTCTITAPGSTVAGSSFNVIATAALFPSTSTGL